MSLIDAASKIREGEELDVAAVDQYLKQHIAGLNGTPEITQFPGGASNLTYQVTYPGRDLILRRPPFGNIPKSAHDMLREAGIMAALKPVFPYVPDILVQCSDHSVMGCDFYVMQRLIGIIPRQNMPAEVKLDAAQTRQLCLNVIDRLIELHQVDIARAGLTSLGKGEGYVARQISGWSDRYRKAKTEDATDFEKVMLWLADNQPADVGSCLIHNDYRFDNVVLNADNPFEVIGVLDWEMATIGDPLMDLGNTLAYWVQADDEPQFQMMRRQPTHLPGMLSRKEVVGYYLQKTGRTETDFAFYEVYGLFRLAAIIQQIYYRYFHGHTKDKRFAGFVHAARYLEQRCLRIIGQ
ncbi:MAG: phosphotransferase family protein [Oceanospirillaceae bacterium]|nr:phosphotransferase family protein [Oceanospirillaceae bacterium]MCP5349594.1 phosphotransferase family protein [Oceanospirillaceae bacterium]